MSDSKHAFTALQRSMWSPFLELSADTPKPPGSMEQRLLHLENDLAIKNLLYKYTYCYDSSNLEGVLSVWHDDCTLVNPRGTYVGLRAIEQNYRYLISTRKFSFHHITNPIVRVSDDGREGGIAAYFACVIAFRSGALASSSGSYVCQVRKTDAFWKISECRITLNTRQRTEPAASAEIAPASSADAPPPPPPPTSPEGSRDWIGPEALA